MDFMVDNAVYSVLGANGFVGGSLVRHLKSQGRNVRAIGRDNMPASGASLGHVIYAIGITSDFRRRTIETAVAHVGALAECLVRYRFDSFLYLSSTRVYRRSDSAKEGLPLSIDPGDPDQLYEATKIAGEALCLALPNPAVRVARLSNVYGPEQSGEDFLPMLLQQAREGREIVIRSGRGSAKDYVHIDDVVRALVAITRGGLQRIYNVAAGTNVTTEEVGELLRAECGARVAFTNDDPKVVFPSIDVGRLSAEMEWRPRKFAEAFAGLCQSMRSDAAPARAAR